MPFSVVAPPQLDVDELRPDRLRDEARVVERRLAARERAPAGLRQPGTGREGITQRDVPVAPERRAVRLAPGQTGTVSSRAATSHLVTTAPKVRRSVVEGVQHQVGDRALAACERVVGRGHAGPGRAAVDPGLVPGADVVACARAPARRRTSRLPSRRPGAARRRAAPASSGSRGSRRRPAAARDRCRSRAPAAGSRRAGPGRPAPSVWMFSSVATTCSPMTWRGGLGVGCPPPPRRPGRDGHRGHPAPWRCSRRRSRRTRPVVVAELHGHEVGRTPDGVELRRHG